MLASFIHGFILALGLILPLGVQNVFVFNQGALQPRFIKALPVVITAALCDTLLILVAVLGVSFIILGSFWIKTILIVGGSVFLIYMGWISWNSKPSQDKEDVAKKFPFKKQVLFAASVSLLNPHAIMDTIGVIGTSSLKYQGEEKVIFAVTCILVSWIWFMGLALAGRISGKLDQSGRFMLVLNKLSALVMWGAAIYLVFSLFFN
ncbi:LysE/ArgO family amino acid transporter [Neobacillus vireti]|uniref:Lysine exporter protein LysE/YggA n=1 Tax=Neobacillus vireti LMG 21834 TaxID=1131730 RepID=A0AB94IFK8_9BACI|nr:LysE/ArgO family amino acid transporter [Neobacillus vireti]ETI65896.1 lysine exporter protein LysE/YggA [Neobacillus vireti LMG 21834]KLT17739.1 LysE family L-lysine exporter [Neobacillus vireti]